MQRGRTGGETVRHREAAADPDGDDVQLGRTTGETARHREAFAPTPAASCFRLLGAIACELGLDLCHFDAEQAFVQSSLERDVFMRLPPGCGEMSGIIVRLNRSLRLETSVEVVA